MIRVFIGCAPNHEDAESQLVLEYTLRKHSSEPLDLTWMKLSRDPSSSFFGWRTENWPTPFSGFRWALPALCGFEGRAIYLDSDMICMADISELWNEEIPEGCWILAKSSGRLCVSLWDCSRAPHFDLETFRSDPKNHRVGRNRNRSGVASFKSGNWNCLDGEKYESLLDPEIKMIHYTSMPHQPHLPHALSRLRRDGNTHWFDGKITRHWREDLITLFNDLYVEAQQSGYTLDQYLSDPPFGNYSKSSVSHLGGSVPSWSA